MRFPLPDTIWSDLVATILFGLITIFLIVIGYFVFDKLTPRLNFSELISKGNTAMAIVLGSFILGLCYVIGRVVAAVLGVA